MKVKSNIRSGSGGGGGGGGGSKSSQINNTVAFYIPPVSRCVGI
jgi:hypothetical protein